ncbi:uncharacterized protein LOC129871827 [Solanum dulcamara]|uniref:uncharacterized protein LOC129871827 n=1 Tax=Solanum dulcamara TaxID=45834 RepID=UPI0024866F37|nr:uncharacterized protein LOC129871827 [Solanum dulcamara]
MQELEDDAHDSVVSEDETESKIDKEAVGEDLSTKQPKKEDKKHGEKTSNAKDATSTPIPIPQPPPPFPQRLKNKAKNGKFIKFISMLKQLLVNVYLIEALEQMSGYAKFMKYLVIKKETISFEPADNLHCCSAITTHTFLQKKEDPGAFTIPCTIEERLGVDALAAVIINIDKDHIGEYDEIVCALNGLGTFNHAPKRQLRLKE